MSFCIELELAAFGGLSQSENFVQVVVIVIIPVFLRQWKVKRVSPVSRGNRLSPRVRND